MREEISARFFAVVVLGACFLLMASYFADAQEASALESVPRVTLKILHSPAYPPLARQAGITGDVTVNVTLHPDGTVDSVTPVTGHPLLVPSVVDSVKQSAFECVQCGNSVATVQLTYSFQQSPREKTDPCCCSKQSSASTDTSPHVSQSGNHITITATAPAICVCPDLCDMKWAEEHSHVRSPKCLYLWKCGRKMIYID